MVDKYRWTMILIACWTWFVSYVDIRLTLHCQLGLRLIVLCDQHLDHSKHMTLQQPAWTTFSYTALGEVNPADFWGQKLSIGVDNSRYSLSLTLADIVYSPTRAH